MMKKSLLPIAITLAGSAFATPFNAGDTKTFSMGGIGVSSADAGQSSIMNPALLATDLRRDLFAFEVDLVTVAPKVGGFGEIANDFIERDVVDQGIEVFDEVQTQITGTGGLIELSSSLQTSVSNIAFTSGFTVDAVTISLSPTPTTTEINNAKGQINNVQTSLTTIQGNIDGLTDEDTGTLTAVSNDSGAVATKLQYIDETVEERVTDLSDNLLDWLQAFQGKDAFVEASVIPLSFAMPDRQWGWGIHIDNYIQFGVTLNFSENDATFLEGATSDATGWITEINEEIGSGDGQGQIGVAQQVSNNTNSSSDIQTGLVTLNEDITDLNTQLTAFNNLLTELESINPPTNAAQTTRLGEIVAILNDTTGTTTSPDGTTGADGSPFRINQAQNTITTSAGAVETSATNLQALQGDFTDAINEVQNYTQGVIVNGQPNVSIDDFDSELAIAIAAVEEVGISLAREFVINGQAVSLGVTPKLQIILIEDYVVAINEADSFETRSGISPLYRANIDLGAAKEWDWHGTVKAGATIKNLIPYTLKSPSNVEVKMMPKLRIGASHHTPFSTVGVDLDITNNTPFYFGKKSRQIAIGGELSAWGHAALRAGANWNLSDPEDSGVATFGLGLTPFGTGLNFALWVPFDAFTADYGSVISDASDGEYGSALTTGDKLLRDFGASANLQIAW